MILTIVVVSQRDGLYYLKGRYYDPKIFRFINADSQISTNINGLNLFSYCFSKACSLNTIIGYMFQSINDGGGYGLYGLGGGTCLDIANTLKQLNIPYSWADYDSLSNVSDSSVMIVGFWTRTTIFNGHVYIPSIHTVAVQRAEETYYAYNYYSDGTSAEPFGSLEAIVREKEKFIYGFIIYG